MKLPTVVKRCKVLVVLLAAVPCLSSAALLEQAGRPTAPQGAIIPNRFIVALKPGYGDAATAAAGLVREVKAALHSTAAAAAGGTLPVRVCGPTSRVGTAAGGGAAGAAGGAAGSVGGNTAGGAAAGGLPRVPVAANEQVPAGVQLIGAVSSAGVANMAAGKPLVVAVVDSGVDSSHPDINYVGGKAFVAPSAAVPGDSADPATDLYGHGTHVAGIIGARNGGAGGVVGVAPGVGIFSLKVMDAQGVGSLSDAMDAVTWAAGPEGKAAGIAVINLSLAGYADPAAPDYAATRDYVCGVFQAASAAGLVVVAAAGNYATDLRVTSMDPASASVSSFSNYLAEPATAADRARLIAAPGNGILSTISFAREASGYRELSGTSMASPHIAGVAATCIASGACSAAGGFANAAVLQAAAKQRAAAVPTYGFDGDARSTRGGKYYGYLTWDKW
ncbi:hypothetical protein OEZ86_008218 [Tetradesmus obliquus]|nr:hypothetical protein OEZ86_008218 [Tetradesmus obliquus]